MKPPTDVDRVLQYTTFAANSVGEIASSFKIPFLGSTATLALAILKCVEGVYIQMVEQIHEILGTVVKLHSTSEIKGVLPTALLHDIAKFAQHPSKILEKVFTLLKQQQRMGMIKKIFEQHNNAEKLEACQQELNYALEMFKVRATGLTLSQLVHMRKDAKQCHEELVALLESDSDLTSCEHSSVLGTLPDAGNSTGSLSMLPPSPKIFHGRKSELNTVVTFLLQDSARIAILGTGGMGKTTLAIAAVQNAQVEAKYLHRYFVSCQSTPSCMDLVSMIADHLGLEKQSNLLKRVVHHFGHAPPSLLVLDNLETPWEPSSSRSEVEEFMSLLADISQLALVITMRGAERPAKVKWTQPFLPPLATLPHSAALQTFFDVADNTHDSESVNQLLELTGNLPLAVSLIATVAGAEGCDSALSRWKSESTRMLSDGYDKRSSLDISIMLSFTSYRMTPGAQDLLSILSMLPNGFTDADLLQAELPIPDILASKTTLLKTALAFVDTEKQIQVLAPIREHILHSHPPTNVLKLKLCMHFHNLLSLWKDHADLNAAKIVPQLLRNGGNITSVLQDSLDTDCPDAINESILTLNQFYVRTQNTYSPLLLKISEQICVGTSQCSGTT
ncbi:P-loop containing nucleoside triphosphate hydrolase protein [Mycena rebaudengoi]|nr:P-loop containing nucleoside triphosphate hydrolase protein [Mycena rebaudengoi]